MDQHPVSGASDDRYEWIDVSTLSGHEEWIRGRCLHRDLQPVHEEITGDLVAWLCPDCDQQFVEESYREFAKQTLSRAASLRDKVDVFIAMFVLYCFLVAGGLFLVATSR